MLPVILSIGKIPISSFGLFLALAFLLATFLVWRLARAWDLNEERILDLILLVFFGSLIGARIFFVSLNFGFFAPNLSRILLITNYPGLSFWGGLLGGWLTLIFFTKKFKLDFLQVADLAAIGLLGGLVLGDIGCFLGGCGVGVESHFLGVNMAGVVGKRFPIQVFEALAFAVILLNFWPKAIRFHFPGKILSISLIAVGAVKFLTNFLKISSLDNLILSLATFGLGIFIYLKTSKKPINKVIAELTDSLSHSPTRLVTFLKTCYNQRAKFRSILRRLRVRPTPKNI